MRDPVAKPLEQKEPPLGRAVLAFLAAFFALSVAYQAVRESAAGRFYIEDLVVAPAAALTGVLLGDPSVHADGSRVRSAAGSLNVLNGCEGVESILLLVAAFVAAPIGWKRRLQGMATGALLLHALNLGRIVLLFAIHRHAGAWFGVLHGIVLPVALVAAAAGFLFARLGADRPDPSP